MGVLGEQLWSMLVGLPLCAVGGVLYSWASGKGVVAGMISAYGALFKVPGPSLCVFAFAPEPRSRVWNCGQRLSSILPAQLLCRVE